MRKNKVLVYHASNEEFKKFYDNELFKFKGKIENYGIYYEFVISTDDIRAKLNDIISRIDLDDKVFEEKLFSLKDNLCRIIFNSKAECIFFLVENLNKWKTIAEKCELKEWDLLNDVLLENLMLNKIEDINFINVSVKTEKSYATISFQGSNVEKLDNFKEYLKYIIKVNSISKTFDKYDIEIISSNHLILIDEDDNSNIRKKLSKVIGIGE